MNEGDMKAKAYAEHAEKLMQNPTMNACAGRMSARNVLIDRANRLRREADGLMALSRAIPENFPHDADEALWELAIGSRR
jgi:hypothetical protein